MTVIGVTGGIGAGKSSVSTILQGLGAIVIDADQISRGVVQPRKPAWIKIKQIFGDSILNEDGTLNRGKLAQIVFSSEEKKLELERIIHKEVVCEIEERLKTLKASSYDGIVVLDVPIPVKRGFLDIVDRVWVVFSDDEVRINRVMERSDISREDAENRIKSQLTQDKYKELAHEIIENNGSLKELDKKVKVLYKKLKQNVPE